MRIVLAKKMSPNNINVAYVKGEKIRSDDVLQFKDMSGEISANQLPIFTEARQSTTVVESGTTTKIRLTNDVINPKITSEYNFVKETAEIIPLWQRYSLKKPHFNNSGQKKIYVINNCEIDKAYQILALQSPALMCINTLKVINSSDSNAVLTKDVQYIYNNGTRVLKITDAAVAGDDLIVTFYIINNSITVTDDLGNELQRKYVRLEPTKFETTPSDSDDKFGEIGDTGLEDLDSLYSIDILFANVMLPEVSYFVEYLSWDMNTEQIASISETLNPESLYTKVDSLGEFDTFNDRNFEVDITNDDMIYPILTKIPTTWDRVFVEYPTNRNTRLSLVEPDNVPHDLPWFIEVSNEKLVVDSLTYVPIEKEVQGIVKDEFQITNVIEPIVKLDDSTIKTQYNSMYVSSDNLGNSTNITIINDGIDISSNIDWVDTRRGIIKMKAAFDVSEANNEIRYSRYIFNVQYNQINVNPFMIYNQTNNAIMDKFVMIYMMPLEEIDQSKGRTLFHSIIYKFPERYDGVLDHQLSIENATQYIRGEGPLGHDFLFNEIKDYVNSSISKGDTLHPIILGYISSSNITTPEGLEFVDVRRRGGGLAESQHVNELYAGNERQYLDISKIDGYNYDLSNIAIVKIKKSVRNRMQAILTEFDPHAQRQIRDGNTNFDIIVYTESYIENIVRKYLNAACHITILYED